MRSAVRACSMLLMTCALLVTVRRPATTANRLTNKVVIVDAASGSTASKTEENLGSGLMKTVKVSRSRTARPPSSVASMTAGLQCHSRRCGSRA